MSRKSGKDSVATTGDDGSPPTAVDFIFRTMIARAGAPGKRQIRPKNVEDLLNADIQELGSDEDPDFDVSKDKYHNESDVSIASDDDEEPSNKGSDDDKRSMDGNVEDSDDEDDESYDADKDPHLNSSNADSEEDDSNSTEDSEEDTDSQSPVQKRSALRETLQKLNDSEFTPQQNRKRKRPRKAGAATSKAKGGGTKKDDASGSNPKKSKASAKGKDTGEKKASARGGSRKKSVEGTEKSKEKAKKKKKSNDGRGITDMVASMEKMHMDIRKEISVRSPICSACLGKSSDEMNEIVECDSCGITVHEACYGVSDTLSVSSGTGSSCSTEPWFCDACRTGAKQIFCELCPMQHGLFKETTAGRWVHLVCALYTPGVVITDSGLPSLFEIPYAKWGAYPCSLCEDVRFSRTGICIPCDAGMCKTYLHATCAQKHGLLSDPVPQGVEVEADPFYAACKLHTNRETSKRRAKCFAILQEQLRIKHEQKLAVDITPEERNNQNRIKRKLERIRFKVAVKQAHNFTDTGESSKPSSSDLTISNLNALPDQFPTVPIAVDILPQSWKDGVKKARLMSTSAGLTMAFHRKALLMGKDIKALELEDKHRRIVASVHKKWNVPPGLSVEYAAYYADREHRITNLNSQCQKLEKENFALNNKQMDLQVSYDRESVHNELMSEDTESMRQNLIGITTVLRNLCSPGNKKLISSIQAIESRTEIPGGQHRRSPSHSYRRSTSSPSKGGSNKKAKKSLSLSPALSSPVERLAIKVCSICDRSDQQHNIIRCDNCKKFYHLKCLDPPLTRLPKRSRQCGWMCSDCGEEEFDADEEEVDTDAPRTLRGRTKIRKPGKYRHSTDSREGDLKIVCDGLEANKIETSGSTSPKPVKTEPLLTSPVIANGIRSSKKRRSGSSILSNASSLLSPTLLQAQSVFVTPEANGPTTKNKRRASPKKPKEGILSLNDSLLPAINEVESPVQKKSKQPRGKKAISVKVENDVTDDNGQIGSEIDDQPKPKVPKVKRSRKSSNDTVKTSKKPKSVSPKKKQIAEEGTTPATTESTNSEFPISPQKKNSPSKVKAVEKEEVGDISSSQSSPTKKGKRSRKSLAELQKLNKRKEEIIIGSMMAAAAAAEVTKSEDGSPVVPNGKTKQIKRRKSSNASILGVTGSGAAPIEKEKSVPPKKRKRVASSAAHHRDNSHEDAIIDAVASGCSGSEDMDNQKNGIARTSLPDGVLMQGMAHSKSGWNNNSPEDEHSIMKGHAMGSNCSSDEMVTVNASDLLDCVLNEPSSAPTTTVSSYSPGFYSSSTPNTTSIDTKTSIPKYVSSSISSPNTVDSNKSSSAASAPVAWGQSQQPAQDSQQNVIKLIYEASEAGPVRPTVAPYVTPVVPPFTSTVPNSLALTTSEPCGKCFTCNKEELKKNMVTCDKCAQDFHFMCLTPPLKYSPRRRNYAWYCSTCDDNEGQGHQKHPLEAPFRSEQTPTNSAHPLPQQQQSRLTVHLFEDDCMKNLFKKFKP